MRATQLVMVIAAYLLVLSLAMLAIGAQHTYLHALAQFGARPRRLTRIPLSA